MEPRAHRRRRSAQQARSLSLAVLSAAILATGSFAATLPATQAISVAHGDAGTGLRSLSSAGSLGVSESLAVLGAMTAGTPLQGRGVLTVRNTAMRTLQLDVTVTGAPGLMAEVSPPVLEPGETAEVTISGTVEKPGALLGQIVITALGGFVWRKVPLTGEVRAPAAPTPAPVEATPAPVGASPAPLEVSPAPLEVSPLPVEATPAPVAATPAPPVPIPALPATESHH